MKIGAHYDTTFGTLWKDGTYFPRGTHVQVVGLHLDEGYCVRFPADVEGEPLETWEEWSETGFLAEFGTVEPPDPLAEAVIDEARAVLLDAEDGSHLHLHEGED